MPWTTLFLLLMGLLGVSPTCVFNSDFGFSLNCAFKKSSLFRVRNLGGLKSYIGLGFSLGDELGFGEALSNVEPDKRRSIDKQIDSNKINDGTAKVSGRSVGSIVPPFRPIARVTTAPPPPPAFVSLPPSIARIPTVTRVQPPSLSAPQAFQAVLQQANRRLQVASSMEPLKAVGTMEPSLPPEPTPPKISKPSGFDVSAPNPILGGHSVQSLAQASNISVDALAAALRIRAQQLVAATSTTTTTTTTTTPEPQPLPTRPKYSLAGPARVMNAPKEYYPVNYDKNFDDHFRSKVELPDTSFSCGDQKHFPGLYADEDLGCMVFHVCAFTDDGLVMKSFLCPESTLFDQTILRCNWWFYVDCQASLALYDSNIPISKSYQLMKALAFFSAYKNSNATASNNA